MPAKPECYGGMFPDLKALEYNRPCAGKVFAALLRSQGIGVQSRSVTVDRDQWDACQGCSEYRSCHDLSVARLLLTAELSRDWAS